MMAFHLPPILSGSLPRGNLPDIGLLVLALLCLPPRIKNEMAAHACASLSSGTVVDRLADEKAQENIGTREHNGQDACQTPSLTSRQRKAHGLDACYRI